MSEKTQVNFVEQLVNAADQTLEVPVQQDEAISAVEIVKAARAARKPRKRAPRATPDDAIETMLVKSLEAIDDARETTAAETPDAKKKRAKKAPAKAPAKKKAAKKTPKPRARNTARAKDRAKQQKPNAGRVTKKQREARSKAHKKPHAGLRRGPKGNPPSKVKRSGDAAFGARVARKRIYLGFTQWELGEKVGIKQPHMCNVEKGTLMPSAELRARLNAVLFDKKTDPKLLKKGHRGAPK